MKLVKSLMLLIIVMVIGYIVYFKVYKNEELRKQRLLEERQLIRFDLNEIKSFTLARPESSIVFEPGIGHLWNITSPILSEADKDPIYQLFSSLDEADILYDVENNPDDISVYGLAKPDYYLAMDYYNNDPDTLFTGSSTPDNTMTYVRFSSENRILAVSNYLTAIMKNPLNMYRSRTLLNFIPRDIIGLEILDSNTQDNEQQRIACQYDGQFWNMTAPWNHIGDQDNINELLTKISEARKARFIAEKTDDLSQYGLDNPQIIVNFSQKYGMPDKMLLIGNRLEEKGKRHLCYAKQFDKDLIFLTELSVITALRKKPIYYIVKTPLKFNKDSINKIVLETTQKPITFYKNTRGNWSTLSPIEKNLDLQTINRLFTISRYLIINHIYKTDPNPEDLTFAGLDNPKIKLSLYVDDRITTQLLFGNTIFDKQSKTYVRTNLSPIIYETEVEVNSYINDVLVEVFGS